LPARYAIRGVLDRAKGHWRWFQLLGARQDELEGWGWTKFIHPHDRWFGSSIDIEDLKRAEHALQTSMFDGTGKEPAPE
jgi:hypothetical protein